MAFTGGGRKTEDLRQEALEKATVEMPAEESVGKGWLS